MLCCRKRARAKSADEAGNAAVVDRQGELDLEIGEPANLNAAFEVAVESRIQPPLAFPPISLVRSRAAEVNRDSSAIHLKKEVHLKEEDGKSGADSICTAINGCQLIRAARLLEDSPKAIPEDHSCELRERAARIRRVLQSCAPPEGGGWKRFDLETCTLWRCWDTASGELKLIMSWEIQGSLLQQISSIRDADVAEPFWDGACWDMTAQHRGGASLVRWLQKDLFSGKKQEILLERVLCDCLDDELPCWVLSERSPDVERLQDLSGKYGLFDVPAAAPGYARQVMLESGRIIEPRGADRTRTSMALTAKVPAALRWLATDSLLTFGVKLGAKNTQKSWLRLVDQWDSSGYVQRIQEDSAFYGPVCERIRLHLEQATVASCRAAGG
mmetsp:Transcript_103970/g.289710  ORF Transcript_103970/g.289710 Transcript_103970/m.289710 type:complete len:386 (+) Transcript_103970:119-1276(+)